MSLSSLPRRGGTWLVLGLLLWGLGGAGGLSLYWHWRTGPYQAVTEALAARYPGSQPRVEGGRPRHASETSQVPENRELLRVVMKTSFDPLADPDAAQTLAQEVTRFVQDFPLGRTFRRVEVHLFSAVSPGRLSQWTGLLPVARPAGDDHNVSPQASPLPPERFP